MNRYTVPTYTATIHVGLREGRTNGPFIIHDRGRAKKICQEYCDVIGLCVSFTDTEYIYTGGNEPGIVVGLINYPRFPSEPWEIRAKALELADILRFSLGQLKVSVVFQDETVMLGLKETA